MRLKKQQQGHYLPPEPGTNPANYSTKMAKTVKINLEKGMCPIRNFQI